MIQVSILTNPDSSQNQNDSNELRQKNTDEILKNA